MKSSKKSSKGKKSGKKSSSSSKSTKVNKSRNISKDKSKNIKHKDKNKSKKSKKERSFKSKLIRSSLIILASFLILWAIFYFSGIQTNALPDNELYIDMTPLEYSITMNDSETAFADFTIGISSSLACNTKCVFELKDISSNKTIYQETNYNTKHELISVPLNISVLGEGQSIFSFETTCNNVKTTLCSSNENQFFKSSLITVNHDLSEEDVVRKANSKARLDSFMSTFETSELLLLEASAYINELDYYINSSNYSSYSVEEIFLSNKLSDLMGEFNRSSSAKNDLLNLWNYYEFEDLLSKIDSYESDLLDLQSEAKDLHDDILLSVSLLKNSVDILNNFKLSSPELIKAKKLFNKTNALVKLSELDNLISKAESLSETISNKSFVTLGDINSDVNNFKIRWDSLMEDYKLLDSNLSSEAQDYENLFKDIIYYLDNAAFMTSSSAETAPSPILSLDSACQKLSDKIVLVNQHNILAQANKESLYPFLNQSSLLVSASDLFIDFVIDKMNNSSASFYLNNSIYGSAPTDYPITVGGLIVNTYNISSISQSDFRDISKLNVSNLSSNFVSKYCYPLSLIVDINLSSLPNINTSINISNQSKIIIPELKKLCCYMGDCEPCCDGPECVDENIPLVLVHGHSFNKANSPEQAFSRLSKLQRGLETISYVNAGQISADSDFNVVPNGDWGRMNQAVSVRVTYYYITHKDLGGLQFTTRKTDSIENYAIRLRESINEVKRRTGKDKVILVAHSMGGLVSREYIHLFGGSDVEKLITLGTPNKGIEGDVKRFCTVTGAKKECEDMYFDSIFINRLNSPSAEPKFTDVYTVTAHGCMMSSENGREDGDGVVVARNVALDYAVNYHINGTCTDLLNTNLHMRFVEPDAYPETFEIISEILAD